MNKIFEHYNDLHVRGTYVYAKANDVYVYSDSDKTVKIDAAKLKDLFLKGVIIDLSGKLYKPTGLAVNNGVVSLSYVTPDTDTATTAVMALLYSKEYI